MHFLGVAGMPRRVPDYPDAFYAYNKIASWGSYVSAWSVLVFFFMLHEAFSTKTSLVSIPALKQKLPDLSPMTNIVAAILAMFFIYCQIYVLAIFVIVGFIYLNFLAHIMPYDKQLLLKEHKNIDESEIDFQINKYTFAYLFALAVLGFMFNVIVGKFYFTYVLLSIIATAVGFKIADGIPTFLINYYKKVRKDQVTLKYHWYTNFKAARSYIHISLASLVICLLLKIWITPFYTMDPQISEMNTKLWYFLVGLHCFVGFGIDTYIIFALNTVTEAPVIGFCKTCIKYGLPATWINQQAVNNNVSHPNGVSNIVNKLTGNPTYVDSEQVKQHRVMSKWFPELDPSNYTTPDNKSWISGSSFNSNKALEYAHEHREQLRGKLTRTECQDMKLPVEYAYNVKPYAHGKDWKTS
jgi:hypothetical protein